MQNQQQTVLAQPKLQKSSRKSKRNLQNLSPIPNKQYFTIGEVSKLCLVKPYVLRYWEREFPKLSPATRRGKRRYYQHEDILLIRRIKSLLYEQGFTIEGARAKLNSRNEKCLSDVSSNATIKLIDNVISQLDQILLELEK